ncbi:RBA50 RNA polymerase II-associated protein RBA50 [Candida maltosa Xu316]|uniref:RNA polymerase II-associated protein, putative n=1 Tax=Candida maltosa (strain Xu316) TaxID=1245528 RepID=M3J3E0_CANMX|nr:RNA polymerase II-associated protein, putative [Candida maltosa Xu316]
MDFIGEIIEHETETPQEPVTPTTSNGFPELGKLRQKKVSKWKQRQQKQAQPEPTPEPKHEHEQPQSEAEKIHQENLDRMASMTEEEISQERQELLESLDPNLIQSLINRSKKRENADKHHDHDHSHHHEHAEGYNGWIGAMKTSEGLTDLSQLDQEDVNRALGLNDLSLDDEPVQDDKKKVKFDNNVKTVNYEDLDDDIELDPNGWEDVTDINELVPNAQIAPDDYQINPDSDDEETPNNTVHFTKPKPQDLDLNDPEFFDKLHEKYFPDLPKETDKLSWMTQPMPKQVSTTYESISDMRFDFKGDLIELNIEEEEQDDKSSEIPSYMGLHHHSDNPHMAGYTLSELAHLARSSLAAQRCISIQTLGRILHKLGLHKYSILPISDETDPGFNEDLKQMSNNFENMMWDLIDELRIIETLTEAADEKKTRNLSVRNYAIEALWLYKTGGGRPKKKAQTEEEIITEAVQS